MEEVLFLVEWPTVAEGQFAAQHLSLPAEVLETAMQSHQRYFPLVEENGALSNRFLYVTNGDPAWVKQITAGNERVLQGRIEDAEFSFEKDKATGLEAMASQLGKIVFHVKAGSMKDKTDRLVALTGYLAEVTGAPGEARERALEAARLAKADQVSIMVREFADLEGVMGETYALMEGHHPEVAQAIREQFLPDAAGGAVPATVPGALLATAEKVDNIVAAFACGEPPSGSKDPYGLRRAAAGMVAIAMQHGLRYDVEQAARPGLRRAGALPRPGGARDAWCPRRRPSSWSVWPRPSPTTGWRATRWTRCCPPRATSWTCGPRAQALHEFRSGAPWEDLVTVFTRPSNLAKKLPAEAAAERRPRSRVAGVARAVPGRGRAGAVRRLAGGGGQGGARRSKASVRRGPGGSGGAAPGRRPLLRRRAGHGRGRGGAAQPAAPTGRDRGDGAQRGLAGAGPGLSAGTAGPTDRPDAGR